MGVFTWWATERTAYELRMQRREREYEAKEEFKRDFPRASEILTQFKASFLVWPIVLGGMVAGWYGRLAGILTMIFSVVAFYFWWRWADGDWFWGWLISGFSVGVGKVLDMLNE